MQYRRSGAIGVVFVASNVALDKAYRVSIGMSGGQGKPVPPVKLLGACVMLEREGNWQTAVFFSRPAGK